MLADLEPMDLQGFSSTVGTPGELATKIIVQVKPVDVTVEAGAQIQQLVNVECVEEFNGACDSPVYLCCLFFVCCYLRRCRGNRQLVGHQVLPKCLCLFFRGMETVFVDNKLATKLKTNYERKSVREPKNRNLTESPWSRVSSKVLSFFRSNEGENGK